MRYIIGDNITFKIYNNSNLSNPYTHYGSVIDFEHHELAGDLYVIKTKYGNVVKLTEAEVD